MKIVAGLLVLLTLCISAVAQDARVIAELTASSEKIVKNSPFSAEAVSESIQVLADGNRIVRSSTNKLYRNGEGRFRREIGSGSGSVLGSLYSYNPGVTILDPVIGHKYLLDTHLRTAHLGLLKPLAELKFKGNQALTPEQREQVEKLKTTLRTAITTELKTTLPTIAGALSTGGVMAYSPREHSKYESRTEQLGKQNIEGVEAEGTRTITTIPAGAIGNERPIEITYERWYSDDLHLVVKSRHSDPRFGEQTYRLTNIVRSEPDPSLFSLPTGYKVISAPSSVYKVATTKMAAEQAAIKAAASPASTVVKTSP